MTHHQYLQNRLPAKPSTPCHAYDLTFGGRCLNCGFNPDDQTQGRRLSLPKAVDEFGDVQDFLTEGL